MRCHQRSVLSCVSAAVTVGALSLGAGGAAAATMSRIGTPAPIPTRTQPLGTVSPTEAIDATVTLAPANPAALESFATDVSTPGSAIYHQYLNPAQFATRFGASSAEIDQVRGALAAEGLTVGSVASNGLSLEVSAPARTIESAFAVTLSRYRLADGATGFAPSLAPAVPASIASDVQGVLGLDTVNQAHPLSLQRAHRLARPRDRGHGTGAASAVTPCAAASSDATEYGAYTPNELAEAYRFTGVYSGGDLGSGAKVALYELEPHLTSDITAYQKCMGTDVTVTNTTVDGGAGRRAGEGEAALDIEDVIGLAPGASIDVYTGPNTEQGAYGTYSAIVSADTTNVISTSWGECEADEGSAAADSENTLFEEAASQGQSVFAAAGDSGADDCGNGTASVDDPASQPYVTGVGGTSLPSDTGAAEQTVWNDGGHEGAGGGGASELWSAPSYQKSFTGSTKREVPDVSADANENTGYAIYYDGSWTAIGGTSAAAPLWASVTALADAKCSTAVGQANPALYRAATSAYASDFTDITAGDNSYGGVTGFTAKTGYDEASGLGTPIVSSLVPALCG